jgi:hypothetical protein
MPARSSSATKQHPHRNFFTVTRFLIGQTFHFRLRGWIIRNPNVLKKTELFSKWHLR